MIADKIEKLKKYRVYNAETGEMIREVDTLMQAKNLASSLEHEANKKFEYGSYTIVGVESRKYKVLGNLYAIGLLIAVVVVLYLISNVPKWIDDAKFYNQYGMTREEMAVKIAQREEEDRKIEEAREKKAAREEYIFQIMKGNEEEKQRADHADASRSECFSEVFYSAPNELLFVRFRESGALYVYYDYPSDEWDYFSEADSLGSFYNQYIKGQWTSSRIDD